MIDCLFCWLQAYSENSGLKFLVTNANKYPMLALLIAPASEAEAYVKLLKTCVFSVCGQLTAGERNRLSKSLEKIIMLWTVNTRRKYYAWFSTIHSWDILVSSCVSGSSAWCSDYSNFVFYFHALVEILCKITNWNRIRNWQNSNCNCNCIG